MSPSWPCVYIQNDPKLTHLKSFLKYNDLNTETLENATFLMEIPKTESFKDVTTTATDLAPKTKQRRCFDNGIKGNENEVMVAISLLCQVFLVKTE